MKDGQRRGARSAHNHALAPEVHACKLEKLDAPIAVGIEADQLTILADKHVGTLRKLRAGSLARCGLKGQWLIRGGDVHGQELSRIQKSAGVVQLGEIGKGIGPGQT